MPNYGKQFMDVFEAAGPFGLGLMGIRKLMKKPDGTTETVGAKELVPEDLTEQQLQTLLNVKKKQAARAEYAKTPFAYGPLTSAGTIKEMLQVPASRRSPEINADIRKGGITKESVILDELEAQENLSPEERTRVRLMIDQLRAKQGKAPVKYYLPQGQPGYAGSNPFANIPAIAKASVDGEFDKLKKDARTARGGTRMADAPPKINPRKAYEE